MNVKNMTLQDALGAIKDVKNSGLDKTASEKEAEGSATEKTSQAQQELVSAINRALESETTAESPEKKGGSSDAVQTLTNMASDLASAEENAIVKEAHLYGAAGADGFMARLHQYDAALGEDTGKTASEEKVASDSSVPTEEEFVKFAEENPELVNQAMEQGYADGRAEVAQIKQAASQQQEWEKFASSREGKAQLAVLDKYIQDRGI